MTIKTLLTAVGVAAILATSAVAPASAAKIHRAPQAQAYDARAYDARAQVLPRALRQGPTPGYFAHGAVDDPPGSAFQSFGNDQAMGLAR